MISLIIYLFCIPFFYNNYLVEKKLHIINILLYDMRYYKELNINYYDFILVICCVLMQTIIFMYFTKDIKQVSSYYSLQRHRQSKLSFLKTILVYNIKKSLKFIMVFMIYITIYIISTESIVNIFNILLCILKISTFYICIGIFETYGFLNNEENKRLVFNYLLIIILILSDLIIHTNFFFYSNEILIEIKYILIIIIVFFIVNNIWKVGNKND